MPVFCKYRHVHAGNRFVRAGGVVVGAGNSLVGAATYLGHGSNLPGRVLNRLVRAANYPARRSASPVLNGKQSCAVADGRVGAGNRLDRVANRLVASAHRLVAGWNSLVALARNRVGRSGVESFAKNVLATGGDRQRVGTSHTTPVVNMEPTFDATPLIHMDTGVVFFDSAPAAGNGRKGIMIQLGLKLRDLTVNALKILGRSIKTGLTANAASFPVLKVTPANLETAVKAVEDQEVVVKATVDKLTADRDTLQLKVTNLENVITACATDCLSLVSQLPEAEAKTKLMSANIPLRGPSENAQPLLKPENFHVSQGDNTGDADGGCDKRKGAKLYRVHSGATANGPFSIIYEGTKSSFTASGLPLGDTWFQMAAFGTNGGWSDWSDPARCTVI